MIRDLTRIRRNSVNWIHQCKAWPNGWFSANGRNWRQGFSWLVECLTTSQQRSVPRASTVPVYRLPTVLHIPLTHLCLPCILSAGTRRRQVVSRTPQIFTPWKGPPLPTEYEAGRVSEQVWSLLKVFKGNTIFFIYLFILQFIYRKHTTPNDRILKNNDLL